ncbi:MAG TPA: methylenetetrahydrofolate reductase [Nitriliruptoraceae bacterium]|nr:methylenetetrahydrofolate reductase [Nitriliruptoraceae bacterium]
MAKVHPAHVAAVHATLRRARFEIIPMKGVEDQLEHLPTDAPVTVTASPTRGLDATIELASTVAAAGHEVIPHLSARLFRDRAHVASVLDWVADLEIEELFVPAGDAAEAAGSYDGAADVLADIRELGFTGRIGITGYPESHPFIDDETTITAMAAKAPHATTIISQICYDPAITTGWVRAVRERGVDLPIHIGLPGVVPFTKLVGISMRVGLGDSLHFLRKQHGVATRLLTGYRPDHIVEGLAPVVADPDADVAGWHLFTFNAVAATAAWWRDLLAATAPPTTTAPTTTSNERTTNP